MHPPRMSKALDFCGHTVDSHSIVSDEHVPTVEQEQYLSSIQNNRNIFRAYIWYINVLCVFHFRLFSLITHNEERSRAERERERERARERERERERYPVRKTGEKL